MLVDLEVRVQLPGETPGPVAIVGPGRLNHLGQRLHQRGIDDRQQVLHVIQTRVAAHRIQLTDQLVDHPRQQVRVKDVAGLAEAAQRLTRLTPSFFCTFLRLLARQIVRMAWTPGLNRATSTSATYWS